MTVAAPQTSSLPRHALTLTLLARFASQVGTSLHFVAQGWFVYRLTKSGQTLGVATIIPLLGPLLLGGISGHLSDRYSARSVLVATQMLLAGTAAGLGLLAYTGRIDVGTLLVGTAVMSVIATFAGPAWQIFTAELAEDGNVRRVTALSTSALDVGTIVGSASAAAVIALMDLAGAFLLNGVSYVLVAVVMVTVRDGTGGKHIRSPPAASRGAVRGFLVRADLLPIMTVAIVASAAGSGLQPLLLILAEAESPRAYGWFLAVLALGSVAGTVLTSRVASTPASVAGSALAMGALIAVLGVAGGAWTVAALLLPVGVLLLSLRAGIVAYIQTRAPTGARGRVISAILAILAGAQIGGTVGLTSLADVTGVRAAMVTAGVSQALIVGVVVAVWLVRRAHTRR